MCCGEENQRREGGDKRRLNFTHPWNKTTDLQSWIKRFFENLSNGHGFSMVVAFGSIETSKSSCLAFFLAIQLVKL